MGFRSSKAACLVVAAFGLLAATASAAPPSRPVTIGLFAEKLALRLGFKPAGPAEAREMLAGAGVTFDAGLDDPLTGGRAATLLSDLGIDSHPAGDPSRVLSDSMAGRLAGMAAGGILGGGGVPPRPEGSLPPSCQTLERSLCFQCCVASLGSFSSLPKRIIDLCNNSCTLMGQPPSSPSGP